MKRLIPEYGRLVRMCFSHIEGQWIIITNDVCAEVKCYTVLFSKRSRL